MSDLNIKEVGGVNYVLKYIPALDALRVVQKLEKEGFSPEVIFEVVSKGAVLGSAKFTKEKFDSHFAGKLQDLMVLFAEILKFNKLVPEDVEGNEEGSEE